MKLARPLVDVAVAIPAPLVAKYAIENKLSIS
jgi:hypothetical protein